MATLAFTTAVKNRATIIFDLDGVTYHFTPGKNAAGILAVWDAPDVDSMNGAVSKSLIDWFSDGLPKAEAMKIRARLEDPEDEFDGTDVGRIAQSLMAEVSGRPFGSPPDSAASPQSGGRSSTPTQSSEVSTPLPSPSTDSAAG